MAWPPDGEGSDKTGIERARVADTDRTGPMRQPEHGAGTRKAVTGMRRRPGSGWKRAEAIRPYGAPAGWRSASPHWSSSMPAGGSDASARSLAKKERR
jgi:hypothetical protein